MHPRCFARLNFSEHRTLVQRWSAWGPLDYYWATLPPGVHSPALHNSPLMMMPRSTPLLFGSLTWKVPLLGTTDSGKDLEWREVRVCCRMSRFCTKRNHLEQKLVPATSNSTSTATLLARAESLSSWWASSRVPSSVGIPLMDSSLSPSCSNPHLHRIWSAEGALSHKHAAASV